MKLRRSETSKRCASTHLPFTRNVYHWLQALRGHVRGAEKYGVESEMLETARPHPSVSPAHWRRNEPEPS